MSGYAKLTTKTQVTPSIVFFTIYPPAKNSIKLSDGTTQDEGGAREEMMEGAREETTAEGAMVKPWCRGQAETGGRQSEVKPGCQSDWDWGGAEGKE